MIIYMLAKEQTKQANQFALSLLLIISSLILFISLEYLILGKSHFAPFTKTRYIYMSCLVILLPLCFGCMQLSIRILSKWHKNIFSLVLLLWVTFWLSAKPAIALFWPLIKYGKPILYAPFKHPLTVLSFFVAAAFVGCVAALPHLFRKIHAPSSQTQNRLWIIFIVLMSILVGSQNVSGLPDVHLDPPRWDANFEPVLYPLSQVLAGKTLLADLPAQYGLYAELIAPLFKTIGFSLSKLTLFFALLEALSFLALASVFLALTKSVLFRLFWILSSAVLFASAYQNYIGHLYFEPYFQYFPIRLFFPAISVFLFWRFISAEPRIKNVIAFSALLTCGVIWNLDSGVPALGSFLAFLMCSAFFEKAQRRWWLKAFGSAICGALAVFTLFAIYMTLKSGVTIPWSEWSHYQRVFYISGYGAIPLPLTPHPWMAVVAVYIIGIVGYMRSAPQPEKFWKLMLYLSIMGFGLFAYYQNRSHDAVLLAAFWPALFMGYVYSEKLLVATHFQKSRILLILPCFILGSMVCGFFIYKAPTMMSQAKYNWTVALRHEKTPITENIAFMRERIHPEDRNSIELVTRLQALYFAELGIPSAIKGPGTGGAMLNEDQTLLIKRIQAAKPKIIFLQQGIMPLVEEALKKDYNVVDNNTNNLLELRIRS